MIGEDEQISKSLSHVRVNMVKRDISEIVATLSNLRMLGEIKTDNKLLDKTVGTLNQMHRAWYFNTFADREIRAALQFSGVGASGYVSLGYKRDFWSAGRGDIILSHHGPRAILPIQIGPDHDLQEAYAVVVKVEMGLMRAIAKWPDHTHLFSPVGDRPTSMWRRAMRKLKFKSPALNASEQDKHKEDDAGFPTVDVYYIYVLDLSLNQSTHDIQMGPAGTKWSYEVPFLGKDIPQGQYNSAGQMLYRKAVWEDCLLYPMRRLLITTPLGVISDDTSPWWHRKVPVIQFKLDDIYRAPEVGPELERAADSISGGSGFMTTNWMEQNKPLFHALRLERLVTFITIGLIVFVAALNILISLTMMVMEKTKDIAVLMSMGTKKKQIRRVFIAQGVLIGVIGTVIGLAIGYAISWAGGHYHFISLSAEVYSIDYVPFAPRPMDGLIVALVSIGISFVATIYPSWAAARILPAEALRYE